MVIFLATVTTAYTGGYMPRSYRDSPVDEKEQEAIARGVIDLARESVLTIRAVKRSVPADLGFALVALYVEGKPGHGLQAPHPSRQNVNFLSSLPTQNVSDRVRSIQFLAALILDLIKQKRLTMELPTDHPRIKRGQVTIYRILAGAA
jgi:hypothetical protein